MIATICLSYSKTEKEYEMTKKCLQTLREHGKPNVFNVAVVETNPNLRAEKFVGTKSWMQLYDDHALTHVVYPNKPFHFNKFLQIGWEEVKHNQGDYVFIINNDLIFHPGFTDHLIAALEKVSSVSPWSPGYHDKWMEALAYSQLYCDYRIGYELCGWAIMFRKSILDIIPFDQLFPDDFAGWYSDNWYAHKLCQHGLKHALVREAKVTHLHQQSQYLIPEDKLIDYTSGAEKVFQDKIAKDRFSAKSMFGKEIKEAIRTDKKTLRIAVYTIALNEEKHAKRWAESCKDADVRLVADTGSTDRTVDILSEEGVDTYSISVNPWRFDTARNTALALIPADVDVCVSMDMDETLSDGWREVIEELWLEDTTRMNHWFKFNDSWSYSNHRIHARHGYYWRWPIHELLHSYKEEVFAEAGQRLVMNHVPDGAKSRGQYLSLLEQAVKEDYCGRTLYYLAREYKYHCRWSECIERVNQYLLCSDAKWDAERSSAIRFAAEAHKKQDRLDDAMLSYLKACTEAPTHRESWCDLAQFYYDRLQWAAGYSAALTALGITFRPGHFLIEDRCWKDYPHDLAAVCAWNMGMAGVAIEHAKKALEYNPNEERLKTNLVRMIHQTSTGVTS